MSEKNFTCPVSKKCGGCQLSNLSYERQLLFKQKKVVKFVGPFCHIDDIVPSPRIYHYRNKVQAAFGTTRGGMIISGVYQSSTHNIVKVDSCLIEDTKADEIIVTVRKLLSAFKLSVYNENTGNGFLRHALVKRAFATNEIMLVLVTGTPVFKSKNDFCKALLKAHPEITTIIQNVNNKFTSMVLGEDNRLLYGKGYITDVLCNTKFRISPASFYQINRDAAEILFKTALDFAAFTGRETILDAYSGVGTIGLIAAPSVKNVISVELNPYAVRDAVINAKINGIENIRFYCADAAEFMLETARERGRIDAVIMDPPRAGSTVSFMKSVCALRPEKIIYISCNPETLARDLLYFSKHGYKAQKCRPVDMFPHTSHVETVSLLTLDT